MEIRISKKSRRVLVAMLLFALVWVGSTIVGLRAENPFRVAMTAAAENAGWPIEDVRMRRGAYTALPFVFWTEAEVVARTPQGERVAEVRLTHIPLLSYHDVHYFNVSAPE